MKAIILTLPILALAACAQSPEAIAPVGMGAAALAGWL